MKWLSSRSVVLLALSCGVLTGEAAGQIGIFTDSEDFGSPKMSGSVLFARGIYTMRAGDAKPYEGGSNHGHLTYLRANGGFVLSARVDLTKVCNKGTEAGLMVRESTEVDARFVAFWRTADPNETIGAEAWDRVSAPYRGRPNAPGEECSYLRLVRKVNSFPEVYEFYASADGISFKLLGTHSIHLGGEMLVGLALRSHKESAMAAARFHHVTFEPGLPLVIRSILGSPTYVPGETRRGIQIKVPQARSKGDLTIVETIPAGWSVNDLQTNGAGSATLCGQTIIWSLPAPLTRAVLTYSATAPLSAEAKLARFSGTVTVGSKQGPVVGVATLEPIRKKAE